MKKNLGSIDKVVRIAFALIVAVLWATQVITGTLAVVLAAVGAVLLVTAVLNFCPLYGIFGIRTCKIDSHKRTA